MIRARLVCWWPDGHGYGGPDATGVVDAMRLSCRFVPPLSREQYMAKVQARCFALLATYVRADEPGAFLESLERAGVVALQRRD